MRNFSRVSSCLVLLLILNSLVQTRCSDDSSKQKVKDEDSESRAHYRSSAFGTMPPPSSSINSSSSSSPEARVDAALAHAKNKTSLTPAEFAKAAPSILPRGTIHRPLKDDEVYRFLRNFVVVPPRDNGPHPPLPQKPNATETAAALADATKSSSLTRDVLVSIASNASGAFMAIADSSQGGVVNKEHEFPAWAARDDPFFDLERWSNVSSNSSTSSNSSSSSSSPAPIPESIERAFDRADWTSDQRRGINETAAERLKLGDPASELFLTLDADGDGKLNVTELSQRMPGDTLLESIDSRGQHHPIYGYTKRNGELLARALVRAFDVDGDGALSKAKRDEEVSTAVEALAALRATKGAESRPGRRLIASLVLGDSFNSSSAVLTDKEFAAYASRARATGEMAVTPPDVTDGGDAAVSSWFEYVTKGKKKSVTVDEFVSGAAAGSR